MSGREKRASLRVPCSYPVRIYGWTRELTGRICDISRTGVRVEVPAEQVVPGSDRDMTMLLEQAELALGSHFLTELHYEMLGPLIRKKVFLIRFGPADASGTAIEIAGAFEQALTDEEATMLGVGLPPVGVTMAAAFQDVPGPTRRGMEELDLQARPRPKAYEAFLHPEGGGNPLVCGTDGVEGQGQPGDLVLVAMSPVRGVPGAQDDALEACARRLGARPMLEILDGLRMVWQGPVVLDAAEYARANDELRLLLSVAASA